MVLLRSDLSNKPLAMNNHYRGIEPSRFAADRRLACLTSCRPTKTGKGDPFVSTIESSQNLYAVQWHPEKNAFENALSTERDGVRRHKPRARGRRGDVRFGAVLRGPGARVAPSFCGADAWRFENCVALRTHRPDFVGAYDLPLAWDGRRRLVLISSPHVSCLFPARRRRQARQRSRRGMSTGPIEPATVERPVDRGRARAACDAVTAKLVKSSRVEVDATIP